MVYKKKGGSKKHKYPVTKDLKKLIKLAKKKLAKKKKPTKACIETVKKSYWFAKEAHKGQKRLSDEPYFIHPYETAKILAELGADCKTICAALLHDVIEDTDATGLEVKKKFGNDIYSLVEGVTKLKHVRGGKSGKAKIATMQKMLSATTTDLQVLIIKLADKLHNVRTIKYLDPKSQKRIAKDALEVYAPIAHNLGIRTIEKELQDLSFKTLNPQTCAEIKHKIEYKRTKQSNEMDGIIKTLKPKLRKIGVTFEKPARGTYAIYQKTLKKGGALSEFYNIVVLKIITKNTEDCYRALGILHQNFNPIPKTLKDYIAMPGPNLYQAIHTSVISPSGTPLKVYILTEEMNEVSKKGIIAVVYRKQEEMLRNQFYSKIQDLTKVLWKSPESEPSEEDFFSVLKTEFLDEMIYTFDSTGNRIELPVDSTVLDFAYKIYSESGHNTWRARINGELVPLGTRLEAGDIVEIIFSRTPQVKSIWLKFAKTHNAKAMISGFLAEEGSTDRERTGSYDVIINAKDSIGSMAKITNIISKNNIGLSGAVSSSMLDNVAILQFNFEKKYRDKLIKAVGRIRKLPDVTNVKIVRN